MPTIHLEFGGSTAARTNACPGWHALARTLPEAPSSDAANTGTALHDCMEGIVMGDREPESFIGTMVQGVEITQALYDTKIEPAVVALEELLDEHNIVEYTGEETVAVQSLDDVGGTADIVGLNATTVLLADFKFGDGILVKAENNEQLMHYCMCLYDTPGWEQDLLNVDTIVLAIIQPVPSRADHPTVSQWVIEPAQLVEWAQGYMQSVVRAAKAIADMPTLPAKELLKAGPHCKFCPAEPICPAKAGLFDKAQRLDPHIPAELAESLNLAGEMEQWIKSVRKLAHEQMDRGDRIPGWKLVAKRGSRQWRNEDAVESLVKRLRKVKAEEAFEHKLRSPTQMEQLFLHKGLDTEQLADYIHTISSGTTIAPADDKRPEAPAVAAHRALAGRTAT